MLNYIEQQFATALRSGGAERGNAALFRLPGQFFEADMYLAFRRTTDFPSPAAVPEPEHYNGTLTYEVTESYRINSRTWTTRPAMQYLKTTYGATDYPGSRTRSRFG